MRSKRENEQKSGDVFNNFLTFWRVSSGGLSPDEVYLWHRFDLQLESQVASRQWLSLVLLETSSMAVVSRLHLNFQEDRGDESDDGIDDEKTRAETFGPDESSRWCVLLWQPSSHSSAARQRILLRNIFKHSRWCPSLATSRGYESMFNLWTL